MKLYARGRLAAAAGLAAVLGLAAAAVPAAGAPAAPAASDGSVAAAPAASTRPGTASRARASARPSARARSQPRLVKQDVGGPELASPGVVVHYPARGANSLPQVPASAYVIADARTGQVLAAKDAHGLFPPVSTLKVLTAIALIPRLSPNATVRAS